MNIVPLSDNLGPAKGKIVPVDGYMYIFAATEDPKYDDNCDATTMWKMSAKETTKEKYIAFGTIFTLFLCGGRGWSGMFYCKYKEAGFIANLFFTGGTPQAFASFQYGPYGSDCIEGSPQASVPSYLTAAAPPQWKGGAVIGLMVEIYTNASKPYALVELDEYV